ncbi:hypothetical protein PR202_ga28621 [Eleusine coracana subsp. coracana]|uniref:Uncharacterized protein n=1 Tax=Eleusine coracana subsp. coracana TaxID=191504 RepID=A0AAV5DJP7_ELECO|nr:hypothetical protein PR202_ga28621 [Eleusine coracana subsp. coracana]
MIAAARRRTGEEPTGKGTSLYKQRVAPPTALDLARDAADTPSMAPPALVSPSSGRSSPLLPRSPRAHLFFFFFTGCCDFWPVPRPMIRTPAVSFRSPTFVFGLLFMFQSALRFGAE